MGVGTDARHAACAAWPPSSWLVYDAERMCLFESEDGKLFGTPEMQALCLMCEVAIFDGIREY